MINNDLRHEYSDGLYHQKVAILGPVPPPLGGVTVHIDRVMRKMRLQKNYIVHFDTTSEYRYRFLPLYLMKLFFWLLQHRPQYVYYHTSYLNNSLPELTLLMMLKKKLRYHITLIEHDCRHLYKRTEKFKQRYRTIIQHSDALVLIGSVTQKSYLDAHITMPQKTTVEAAFLPPDPDTELQIIKTYPVSLHAFIHNRHPLILANAFQLSRIQGKDLYGIDTCLHMLADVVHTYPRTGFILALASVGDAEYFKDLCYLLHKLQLENHFYILTNQKELWPLIKKVDLFVRPTLSDGASVSVQEALHFGISTVASDVCRRPPGTVLFSSNDVTDFITKVRDCLKMM